MPTAYTIADDIAMLGLIVKFSPRSNWHRHDTGDYCFWLSASKLPSARSDNGQPRFELSGHIAFQNFIDIGFLHSPRRFT